MDHLTNIQVIDSAKLLVGLFLQVVFGFMLLAGIVIYKITEKF